MYEVFPIVAGVIMGLLAPRFISGGQRKFAYTAIGTAVAALATIIAGEAWFFIFIDLAQVLLAVVVTQAVLRYRTSRQLLRAR